MDFTPSENLLLKNSEVKLKVYRKRWIILLIYVLYSSLNAFQWMEYCIIENVVKKYYLISSVEVDWTSIIYMALYPILVIPASYIIDRFGLRTAAIIGGFGTAIGVIVKIFSVNQNYFYIVLIGQGIGSAAQVFVLCLPSKIAAIWFAPNEVVDLLNERNVLDFHCLSIFNHDVSIEYQYTENGRETVSLPKSSSRENGRVNEQMANKNDRKMAENGRENFCKCPFVIDINNCSIEDLHVHWESLEHSLDLHWVLWVPSAIVKNENDIKKVEEQLNLLCGGLAAIMIPISKYYKKWTRSSVLLDRYFCELNFTLSTVFRYQDAENDVGLMGFTMAIVGMLGSIIFGYILDKTHKYKESTLFIYLSCALAMGLFHYALEIRDKRLVYLAISIVGFFTNAYMPVGFEFAVELTYPLDEGTTTGVLNAMTQGLGVIFTIFLGQMNAIYGPYFVLFCETGLMFLGTLGTVFIPNELKRQKALLYNKAILKQANISI
ncbi:unnamed protein product [Brassicogethes aeneus]|uniref:Major facilitator superfamily (MFS) profile domain-containing protein n=1 Tax=Brassicogethes aeneus TaxID=1431903 RepID=A0A9P0FEI8_BRAAE|nr:unnamed protein product [Brassicogethes aeneus]